MTVTESRNKREGRYSGWVQGHHLRSLEFSPLVGWHAWRNWNEKRHSGRYVKKGKRC